MYLSPTTHGDRVRTCGAGRFVIYDSSYAPAARVAHHYHDVAVMMFATRGSFAENVARKTFDCEAFDVLVRPAGEIHENRYGKAGAQCVIVGVSGASMASLGSAARLFREPAVLARGRVAPLALRVGRELGLTDDVAPLMIEGLLLELIGSAARPVTCTRPPTWLAKAQAFIQEQPNTRVTLSDIAAAAGVHATSVVRGFRAHLRCSPGEYVRRLRIESAMRALESSAKTIAEIALDAGFCDQSHFTRAFRRLTGMTPLQYRNRS